MARIRSIKPEFWDSPDTARADLRIRLLYIAMWNWADDYGIGDGSPVRLIGFAFPRDEIPASDYPRLLSDVSSAFGVVFFEHEGRPFYAIPAWEQHQRTEKKAKAKTGLVEAAALAVAAVKPAGQQEVTEPPTDGGGFSDASVGSTVPGTGEQGKGEVGKREGASRPEPQAATPTPASSKRRKRPATPLPEDWVPTDQHHQFTIARGLDIEVEARKFRLHAEENDRRAVVWNSAFSRWLEGAHPRTTNSGTTNGGQLWQE